jgi:methanogenic corrinoid protein MtbC1
MHDIGRLWEQGKLTVSVEHFASNFFRGLLTNLLHVSPPPMQGPMVLACCAADEPHEIAMLMLSLLLRRKGVRVVYLGQSVETAGILHTIKKLQPAALCVSLTIPTHVTALENLARQVASLPEPRPTFIFGGAAFQHIPYMITQIPGVYLEGDLRDISFRVRELIARGVAGNV